MLISQYTDLKMLIKYPICLMPIQLDISLQKMLMHVQLIFLTVTISCEYTRHLSEVLI